MQPSAAYDLKSVFKSRLNHRNHVTTECYTPITWLKINISNSFYFLAPSAVSTHDQQNVQSCSRKQEMNLQFNTQQGIKRHALQRARTQQAICQKS